MSRSKFTYSHKACVFRKFYGTVRVTIILEDMANNKTKDRIEAIQMLKDEISNFLNDSELEEIFKSQEINKNLQDEKS